MAIPFQQAAFTVGEVGPDLFGRQDLARTKVGASTMRNLFVRYTGGASSRAGTAFVGYSKQTGRLYPPRLIPFQFNINQGLVLEFGDHYMRVVQNGAFVTETPVDIVNISQSNPGVVTTASVLGVTSAVADNTAVVSSYVPGDFILLDGGLFIVRGVLQVGTSFIKALSLNAFGTGYAPGDTVDLAGGVQSITAEITVSTTTVIPLPTIVSAGSAGTPGPAVVTGTTGTGTPFQANVTIDGSGAITSVDSLVTGGSYTVNPTAPANEPVTGGALVGAALSVGMGIETFAITNGGVFTEAPLGGALTQGSTSGSGVGATFQFALFAINSLIISNAGSYTSFPPNPVSQFSTTGTGQGATFTLTSGAVSPFNVGDWVTFSGVQGMTEVNGMTYVVGGPTTTTFQLLDVFGNSINTIAFGAYTGGGTVSRIYTLPTPYAEEDLPYLKYTQSKDVMSLCLVNQETSVEYAPMDLARLANNNWQLENVDISSSIDPPPLVIGGATGSGITNYAYVVTSIDPDDGSESVASMIAYVNGAVNIAATQGTVSLSWTPVSGVQRYNVYKASPATAPFPVPLGSLYGFAGLAYGNQFNDNNIIPDFSQVPPLHFDPFARGQIKSATVVDGGIGYTFAGVTINTSTGSGAQITPLVSGGSLRALIVDNPGKGYALTDTITITGDGAGATATLQVGPVTGTYPSTVSYLQQRRAYANTLNQPDTYFLSQPGAFTNFDRRIPTIDSDAIIGNPWSVQVNGIQWIVNMPGGGVVLTGSDAWQLTGNGGSSLNPQPITPSTQQAQPQAYNGCSPTVPPRKIDYDILYVQSKGSIVRNLSYQYYQNVYTGIDLTLNSPQLFTGFTIKEWAWCEEPYKVMWAVRNDGILLSLTFVKPQEVAGWSRSDTNGLFVSCCSVTELPVDALYVATQRYPSQGPAYMIERMNNRLWDTVEDAWCVDAALSLQQPEPAANLTASSATGLGAIIGVTDLIGGANYSSSTTATIIDENLTNYGGGPGVGATASLSIVEGVITAVTITSIGAGYLFPKLVIEDPERSGSGASASLILDNSMTFEASAAVFSIGNVGDVIRMGGGVATITDYVSPTVVEAQITSQIVALVPNTFTPQIATSGSWTMTAPVTSISGLAHLSGLEVTGTYDGKVIPRVVVPSSGTIHLPAPATQVVVGLVFQPQLQSLYLDPQGATQQGRRKKLAYITARIQASGRFKVGANQADGSTQSPIQISTVWKGMQEAETHAVTPYNSTTTPLWTGDVRIPVPTGYKIPGQCAVEQDLPLPLNILSFIPEEDPGDIPEAEPQKRRGQNSDREQ